MKKSASFRLSDEALKIIKRLAIAQGVSQASALELAVRNDAKQKEVSIK